jgi:hypothetical protein
MEDELRQNLFAIRDAFLARKGAIAESTLALRAAKDARFFDRVETGGGFTVRTYDHVLNWFSHNWPDDLAWPADIERPSRSEVAA